MLLASKIKNDHHSIQLPNVALKIVYTMTMRDLGVTLDVKMSLNNHIEKLINTARRNLVFG